MHIPTLLKQHIIPFVSNLVDLGSAMERWRKIYTRDFDGTGTITVPTPVNPTDAATKAYVDASPGAGVTAEEADGSPSYAATTTLRFDQADGFVLTQPGAGIARIDLAAIPNSALVTIGAATGGTGQTTYTKGDILIASAATTLTKLAVGADTFILTADSTQATGVKWGASGGFNLTVEDQDSNPTYASLTTIRFDQADGFVITQPGAGIVRLDLAAIPNTALVTIGASKGGTGIDTSASTGVAIVTAGTWTTPAQLAIAQGGTGQATAAAARAAIVDILADAKGDIFAATANDAITRLAVGTNGQVLTADSAQATGLSWTTVGGFWTDPETSEIWWEDFISTVNAAPSNNQTAWGAGSWTMNAQGTIAAQTSFRGVIDVSGDAAAVGGLTLCVSPAAVTVKKITNITQNPTLYWRAAQLGTGAGNRFYGFADSGLTAAPVNGIYVRHTQAGTLTAVCRKASTESTLSLGSSAANGTFHTFRAVVTSAGGNVEFFLDGVSKGSITTNVPIVDLAPSMGCDAVPVADGVSMDYMAMKQTR